MTALSRTARRWLAMACCLVLPAQAAAVAASRPLQVTIVNDRLTLSVTHYPQVYLQGTIDAGAPQRFAALVRAGRITPGADIYLDAHGADRAAGMALGRLFRAGGMATHLGTPRQPRHASVAMKTATCTDACVYAYLGGLYRWTPSGRDRLALAAPPGDARDVAAYLAAMGIDAGALAPASPGNWTAERLLATGLANNGVLPATASYDLRAPAPTLELRQTDRKGVHRLTIRCAPGRTTVTAYDDVGMARARQVALRGGDAYFQLDGRKVLDQSRGGALAEGNALVIRRDYPPADLVDLVNAWSFGAWVDGRSAAFRDGFTLQLHPVHPQLKVFYYACWRAAPWPPRAKKAAPAA